MCGNGLFPAWCDAGCLSACICAPKAWLSWIVLDCPGLLPDVDVDADSATKLDMFGEESLYPLARRMPAMTVGKPDKLLDDLKMPGWNMLCYDELFPMTEIGIVFDFISSLPAAFIVKYGLKVALMPESMMRQKQHSSTVQHHNKKHNSGSMAQHTSDRQQDTMAMLDEPESKKVKTVKTAQMDHDLMLAACKRRREDDDDDSEADTPPPAKRQQSDARASIRDDSIPMPQPRSILPKPAGKRTMPTVGRLEPACPTNASTSGRLLFSSLCH
ncbi:hypothetical protein BC831DRAFT_503716 [Entophlyctis helioformis]|nr:hypothetical protein BC831DRAFT_503716 [Entophlyctis helioformis]